MRTFCTLFLFTSLTLGGCSCSGRIGDPIGKKHHHDAADGGSANQNPFDNPPADAGRVSTGEPPDLSGCTYVPSNFEFGVYVCPDGGTSGAGGHGGTAGTNGGTGGTHGGAGTSGSAGSGGSGGDGSDAGTPDGGDDYVIACYFPEHGTPYLVHVRRLDILKDPDAYGHCPNDLPDGGTNGSAGTGGSAGSGGSGGNGGGDTDGGVPPTCHHGHHLVVICHFPPGDPANAHTIHVGASAVKAHLDEHGDHLGPCTKAELANSHH